MLESTTKTTTTKSASSPRMDPTQAFRATAENGSAQAKEAFEKMGAAMAEATGLIKNSYSTAVKGAQDYNTKFIEFAQTNTEAAFDFAQTACRFHGIVDRTFTQAVRDVDRADQGTRSVGPEGHALDRGAPQDGRHQGIQPVRLN